MTDLFRFYEEALGRRLAEKDPLIQVLVGPRQVGKTTALYRLEKSESAYYFTADSPTPLPPESIETAWTEAVRAKKEILLIDEVQKIANWSSAVKALWDRGRKESKSLKLVLSGSAALSIEKGLKESLAGRYELLRATHWGFEEAHQTFGLSLRDYIEWGCYPGAMIFSKEKERWGSYIRDAIIEPVIGRDLLQIHPVEKPALLRQVFGLALQNPAQVVSLQKLQGQLQDKGAIATIQHYLQLLEASFLVTGVQKYSKASIRTKRSSPKLIVHDNALIRALRRPLSQDLNPAEFGRWFENSVIARFIESGWETYYWSDRSLEVDAVVLGPNGEKLAIEIKSSKVTPKDLKGLNEFVKREQEFKPCLVSFVDQKIEGIEHLPVKSVLSYQPQY